MTILGLDINSPEPPLQAGGSLHKKRDGTMICAIPTWVGIRMDGCPARGKRGRRGKNRRRYPHACAWSGCTRSRLWLRPSPWRTEPELCRSWKSLPNFMRCIVPYLRLGTECTFELLFVGHYPKNLGPKLQSSLQIPFCQQCPYCTLSSAKALITNPTNINAKRTFRQQILYYTLSAWPGCC